MSRTIPADEDSVSSSSDMNEDTDYEEDRYSARYYPRSPPKVGQTQAQNHQQWGQRRSGEVNGPASLPKKPVPSRQYQYSSDTYSDLSPSRHQEYPQKQSGQAHTSDYTEDDESESGGSLEFTSGLHRPNGDTYMSSRRRSPQKRSFRNVSFQGGGQTYSEKVQPLTLTPLGLKNYKYTYPAKLEPLIAWRSLSNSHHINDMCFI